MSSRKHEQVLNCFHSFHKDCVDSWLKTRFAPPRELRDSRSAPLPPPRLSSSDASPLPPPTPPPRPPRPPPALALFLSTRVHPLIQPLLGYISLPRSLTHSPCPSLRRSVGRSFPPSLPRSTLFRLCLPALPSPDSPVRQLFSLSTFDIEAPLLSPPLPPPPSLRDVV